MRRLAIIGLTAAVTCAITIGLANAIVLLAARGDVLNDPAKAPRAEAALVLGARSTATGA
jgi:vancomycin permeability regulator SanA